MHSVVITGANRGIGLELSRQYAALGWAVHACCRTPETADALEQTAQAFSNLTIHSLDVSSRNPMHALAIRLDGAPVDVLINNAGVLGRNCSKLGGMRQQEWLNVLNINAIAPALMIQALQENIVNSELKTIVGISSRVGSIGDNSSGGMLGYRASKAALNQVLMTIANDLSEQGVKTLALHPGWVQTDMGGEEAPVNAKDSVAGMIPLINNLTMEQSGSFLDYQGKSIPW